MNPNALYCQLIAAAKGGESERIRQLLHARELREMIEQRLEMTTAAGITDLFSPLEVACMAGKLDAVVALVRYGKAKIEPVYRNDREDQPLTPQEHEARADVDMAVDRHRHHMAHPHPRDYAGLPQRSSSVRDRQHQHQQQHHHSQRSPEKQPQRYTSVSDVIGNDGGKPVPITASSPKKNSIINRANTIAASSAPRNGNSKSRPASANSSSRSRVGPLLVLLRLLVTVVLDLRCALLLGVSSRPSFFCSLEPLGVRNHLVGARRKPGAGTRPGVLHPSTFEQRISKPFQTKAREGGRGGERERQSD